MPDVEPSGGDGEVTPALIPVRHIVSTTVVGLVLSVVAFPVSRRLFVWVLTITLFFALFFGITTAVAYRVARRNGEWPREQHQ
ncbi:hypothetical protein [Motilibacter deserti]|uniref:Uncharacterized protein n=1 Tax=Motilibacter deserti TaxID=2714956 RepID=A0ABX0GRQ6_9ACTN|nr:hypothetical protein [Motilibacter deserti]NHC12395.1 hypothetical protein [Motilibacter deserti]